jgi:hypothetical protein
MKASIYTFIFAFTIFVCSLVHGQTVHWILAIDHWATAQPEPSESAEADKLTMSSAPYYGIQENQLNVYELDLSGSQEQIFDKIRNIEIGNDDTVLFYYSGHGAMDTNNNNNNNNNALTYCIVKEIGERPDNSYRATKYTYITKKSIIDTLREKNPRLIVMLSDCCSTKKAILLSPRESERAKPIPSLTLPLYRSLFLESKGLVDINGAQDGKPSLWYYEMSKGSIFTDAFCRCLNKYKNQRMDWKTFFPIVQRTTEELAREEIKYWKKYHPKVTGQKPKAISLGNSGETVKPPNGEKSIFGVRDENRNDDHNGVTVMGRYHRVIPTIGKRRCILEMTGEKFRMNKIIPMQ